jgi:macrophage erythroblast attacher
MASLEHSVINHRDHLLLDQPLLRLPNELLRKNFRSAHFTIEKESAGLKTILKEAGTTALSGRASQQDVLKNIDAMLARMRGVKRKLTTLAEEESRLHDQAEARIADLDELYSFSTVDDVKYETWSRRRLDRLLADYLLRNGHIESAKELVKERGLDQLVDADTFVAMTQIRDAILNKSVTEALSWCTVNKKELRKMESKLEFTLRFQQYIELIRTQTQPRLLEAIAHAKKHLIPYRTLYPKEVQQACGLLAFSPASPYGATYSELYDETRWRDLADLFTRTHHDLLALPKVPLLHLALAPGLSALKTPACHSSSSSHQQMQSSNQDISAPVASAVPTGDHGVCPICSTELNELARNVPYAHHTQSHVDNDLMLLPNGRVYSKARLEDQARKAGLPPNQVKDQRTGELFDLLQLKKVYIT